MGSIFRLALLLALVGCQPHGPQGVLDEYLTRLARVTGGEAVVAPPEPLPPYPSRRALTRAIPEHDIDVAEFFELHGCDMGELVGFRNSPLGRLQTDSQRLGYEAAWLAAAARCGEGAEAWMVELGSAKQAALPALFWNATFAEQEMRRAFGAGAPAAGGDLARILRGLNDSLTGLERGRFDVGALERQLGELRQGSWVGRARRDWSRWRRHLEAASALLEQAVPGICLNGQPTTGSRRLGNVFVKFYVQQIQPELAVRMREHEAWIRELARLAERLRAVQPEAYRTWFAATLSPDREGSEWRRTERAVVAHAEAWQALFRHCGIEPGPGLGQD